METKKVHVFEIVSQKNLASLLLKDKLEEFLTRKQIHHEVVFATNKPNCLRFKVPSEYATHNNISSFTSFIEDVVGEVSTTCPGFGVPDTDLATFVEKSTAVSN